MLGRKLGAIGCILGLIGKMFTIYISSLNCLEPNSCRREDICGTSENIPLLYIFPYTHKRPTFNRAGGQCRETQAYSENVRDHQIPGYILTLTDNVDDLSSISYMFLNLFSVSSQSNTHLTG